MRRKKERDEAKKRTVNKEVIEEATKTQPQGTRSSMLGLQRKVGNRVFAEMLHGRDRDEKDSVPRIVEEVLSSPGKPLDPAMRVMMEPRFRRDFSKVKVHTDPRAADSAEALNAEAYTVGDQIVFAGGRYAPDSLPGRTLLAHELAHVAQQEGAVETADVSVSTPGSEFESAADSAAQAVTEGSHASVKTGGRPPAIQRQPRPSGKTDAPMLSREETQELLLNFLERARAAKIKRSVSIPPRIRNKFAQLFMGPIPNPYVDQLSQGQVPDGNLTVVASTLANLLPEKTPAAQLQFLKEEIVPPESSRVSKLSDLADKTKVGESNVPLPPGQSGQKTPEQIAGVSQTGPYSVDVLRLGRIAQGAREILNPPEKPRTVACRVPPEVEGELDWVDFEEDLQLLPSAAKLRLEQARTAYETSPVREGTKAEQKIKQQKEAAKNQVEEQIAQAYDNAGETAYKLAALIECAHEKKETSVDLVLKENYNKLRPEDRTGIYKALEKIAGHVKRLLPDAATTVEDIRIFFGNNLVWVIKLSAIAAGPPRPVETKEPKKN